MTTDNNIETRDDDDRDAESDDQTDTRRGVMRSIGIAGAGLAAGLLAGPAAAAVDDATAPKKPIKSVSLDEENGSIEVELVENPELTMLRVIKNESEKVVEDTWPEVEPTEYVVQIASLDQFEVLAYRGSYDDAEIVQEELRNA